MGRAGRVAAGAALFVSLLGALHACSENGPRVPFKVPGSGTGTTPTNPSPAAGGPPAVPEVTVGTAHPPATRRVELARGAIHVGRGAIRASLEVSLTSPATSLVLALVEQEHAPPYVASASAPLDGTLGPLAALGPVPGGNPADAAIPVGVDRATLRTLQTGDALVEADWHVGTAPTREAWIVRLAPTPSIAFHAALETPNAASSRRFRLALTSVDRNDDGRADFVLSLLRDTDTTEASTRVELTWFRSGAVPARDPAEPEATLGRLAEALSRQSRQRPSAETTESLVELLDLHAAICRESGEARLLVEDERGLACGSSAAAGKAFAVAIPALLHEGRVSNALALDASSRRGSYRVTEEQRTAIAAAFAAALATGLTTRVGPVWSAPPPDVALGPRVRFLGNGHLLLRGDSVAEYDPVSDTMVAPTEDVSPLHPFTSPDGKLAASRVVSAPDGCRVELRDPATNNALGPPIGTVLLVPRACARPGRLGETGSMPGRVSDNGGWQVLGWAPQGIVAARAGEARVVPVDSAGQPRGEPEILAPTSALPAPLAPGPAAADGSAYALVTRSGILFRTLGAAPTERLVRTADWPEDVSQITDLALDAGGKRLAAVVNGRIVLVEGLR